MCLPDFRTSSLVPVDGTEFAVQNHVVSTFYHRASAGWQKAVMLMRFSSDISIRVVCELTGTKSAHARSMETKLEAE